MAEKKKNIGIVIEKETDISTGIPSASNRTGQVEPGETAIGKIIPEISTDLPSSSNKNTLIDERRTDISTDLPTSSNKETAEVERRADISTDLPQSSNKETGVVDNSPTLEVDIPAANDSDGRIEPGQSIVREERSDIRSDIPTAQDADSAVPSDRPDIGSDIPTARDATGGVEPGEIVISERRSDIKSDIPSANDRTAQVEPGETVVTKPSPDIAASIPQARDLDSGVQDQGTDISTDISPARTLDVVNVSHDFTGSWLPDLDPAEIGAENFSVYTNLRPGDGHPEGVSGYTQINNGVPLTIYSKIRNGYQLLTDRDTPSYTLVQVENSGETDSKVFLNKTAIPDQGEFEQEELHVSANAASDPLGTETNAITGWASDSSGGSIATVSTDPSVGTYHFDIEDDVASIGDGAMSTAFPTIAYKEYVLTLDVKVIAGSWTIDIRNSADSATIAVLETQIVNAAYVTKTYTWTSEAANERIRIVIDTAATGQIFVDNLSVRQKEIFDDSDSAGLGRFSNAPSGNIAYSNQKESCIWAGDNMRAGALFTVEGRTTSPTDLTFGAGPPGTITTAGGIDWQALGFLPGAKITISACSVAANIGTYLVTDVTTTILSVSSALTGGGAGTGTATISVTLPTKDAIDYTRAINNELTTVGNVMSIGGGNDSDTVLLLHCDGTQGSAVFTDSSASAHVPVSNGNVQLTEAAKKFGTTSGIFDGSGDYISVPDNADWYMAGNPFTIDFWVKWDSGTPSLDVEPLFSQETDDDNFVVCYKVNKFIAFRMWNAGSPDVTIVQGPTGGFAGNTWYHIAIIRGWGGNANDWVLAINGVREGSDVNENHDWANYTGDFMIGHFNHAVYGAGATYHTGNIDEFRVSKGIARWTANFTPPDSQYSNARLKNWTFSTRPLKAINYKIINANGATSTTVVKTWDGSGLTSLPLINDGTSSGGVSLAQDGAMLFQGTENISRPFHFEGLYLYAYLSELSAGDVTVYNVNVNAPFQKIVDVWDGVFRQPVSFQVYDIATTSYKDYTLEVNFSSDSGSSIGGELNALATTEHVIVIFEERMAAIKFVMYPGEANTNTAIPTFQRWDGTQLVSVQITDDTIADIENWESLGKTGLWSWDPSEASEEVTQTLFGVTGYAYRMTFDGALSATVTIDRVFGIPAQKTVDPFAFPAMYRNQLFLFSFKEGKQGNRADYCLPNAPDVWNGDLSSDDGLQSLFFGGSEECTAAIELYNRYGSNIFALLVVTKKTETYVLTGSSPFNYQIFSISKRLGCVAPLTLIAAEVAYQVTSDVVRNIAMWVSHAGPVIFDGTVLSPLGGIDSYFDPTHDNYLTKTAIAAGKGWYDSVRKEYNLLIGSTWLVYALANRKWFLKSTGASEFPKVGFPVVDTDGLQHIYGGIDNGYLIRQEDGNVWEDGDSVTITQSLETGDFFPTGNIWDLTRIHRLKVALIKISEADKNLAITHYADTTSSGSSLTALNADSGSVRIVRATQRTNLLAWAHRFLFQMATSATDKGLQPISWGYQYGIEREDDG